MAELVNDSVEGGEAPVLLPPPLIARAAAAHRALSCADIDGDGDKGGSTGWTGNSGGDRHQGLSSSGGPLSVGASWRSVRKSRKKHHVRRERRQCYPTRPRSAALS